VRPAGEGGGNSGWQTPADFFEECVEEFGNFDLDPSGAHNAYVSGRAPFYCTEEGTWRNSSTGPSQQIDAIDGLNLDWGKSKVFLNPPYNAVAPWALKARLAALEGAFVVALLPPAVDSKWFHSSIWDKRLHRGRDAIEVRFLPGRLKFTHPDPEKQKSAPVSGNMLAIFRPWQ